MGSNWVDPREARTDPAHRNTEGNGRGGAAVALACLLPLISAPPKRDPLAQRGRVRESEMKERTTMERRVYYFERQIELGWLPFFSANTEVAATVSNLDKNTSSAAAEAASSVGCGIRSRWLPIISETFLIAKVD